MNLITTIERVPPSDLVSDELDLLLKRTQRGLVVLEQVRVWTDRQTGGQMPILTILLEYYCTVHS